MSSISMITLGKKPSLANRRLAFDLRDREIVVAVQAKSGRAMHYVTEVTCVSSSARFLLVATMLRWLCQVTLRHGRKRLLKSSPRPPKSCCSGANEKPGYTPGFFFLARRPRRLNTDRAREE